MKHSVVTMKMWLHGAVAGIAALLFLSLSATTAHAAAQIKSTEYEGKGKVEVEFTSKVRYLDLQVTVKDEAGKKVKAVIVDTDSDDVEFILNSFKKGTTYSFKLKGVAKKGESTYDSLSGSFMIPKSEGVVPVEKVEYDARDGEVSFEFEKKVDWKNPKVTIKSGGKNYVLRIDDKDKDEIEVDVNPLKKGKVYEYTISGIRLKGKGQYATITGTFRA